MTYDGLGNRLEMTTYSDGEGNTTRYQLDNGQTLSAIGTESSTFYLYGLGAIGTLNESWSYILSDGAGSTRQLVDEEGAVQLSVSYTPWGDTMEVYGSGMLNLGYLGGVYDAGTGLIYMGNGQYYDPSTGRFLTRGMADGTRPFGSDPVSMLITPLVVLGLIFGRKKKHFKNDQLIIMMFIGLSISLAVFTVGDFISNPVFANVNESSFNDTEPPDLPFFRYRYDEDGNPIVGTNIANSSNKTENGEYPVPTALPLDTMIMYFDACFTQIPLIADDISAYSFNERTDKLYGIYLEMFETVFDDNGKMTWWWKYALKNDRHFSIKEFATILYTHETSNASWFMTDDELNLLVEAIGRKSSHVKLPKTLPFISRQI
ncbi:MAG: hypothetical protein JEZ00_21875 [Anaerolineaceae bacterium]|nr:hypothetical protein [Anaerolineaceae bacterium]